MNQGKCGADRPADPPTYSTILNIIVPCSEDERDPRAHLHS